MPEAQVAQADAQQHVQQQQNGQQGQGDQAPKSYSQADWDARQREFDSKADKIRRNAERNTELRFRREAQAPQQQQQEQRPQPQVKADEPPVRKDDEPWEDFVERKAEYAGRKAAREEREAAKREEGENKAKEQRAQAERTFKQRCDAFAKDTPDFIETMRDADDVFMSPAMGEAMTDSEVGAQMLYHLVKTEEGRAECARIAEMSPSAALRAMGKLEARIEAELKAKAGDGKDDNEGGDGDAGAGDANADGDAEAGGGNKSARQQQDDDQQRNGDGTFKPKKAASKAPDPIEPVGGRAANTNQGPSDKDDSDTWLAKRNAELARRGRR